jgi:hypothetical protein
MTTWLRLTLITMTVGGGFAGVVLAVQLLMNSPNQATLNLLLAILLLLLYTFVTAAGLVFAHSPHRLGPLVAALAIQVPWISSPLLVYQFAAGVGAFLGANYSQGATGLSPNYEYCFGSRSTVAVLRQNPLGVNLWAVVLLILLWRSTWTLAPVPQSVGTSEESLPV